MKTKLVIVLFSILFVLFSMLPTFYEYLNKDKIPRNRYFTLEHNYNFDYNFYLSRIRQGMTGRWTVTEKYYNQPHQSSLFQIIYLYLGRIGGFFNTSETAIYQSGRFIFGLILLLITAGFGSIYFKQKTLILFFLLAVTSGSWPILVRAGLPAGQAGAFYRFATYMGNWSVVDSLQRITIMPHILIGQIMLVWLIIKFALLKNISILRFLSLGIAGFTAGIIFPPTLIILYTYFLVLSAIEILDIFSLKTSFKEKKNLFKNFLKSSLLPKIIFILLSLPSLIYAQVTFSIQPWKALVLFDIEHRMPMLYIEYLKALGPVFILGLFGLIWLFIKNNKKYYCAVAWITAIGLLFLIFENVPQQSPLRFTEGLIHIPLAVLATYFLSDVLKNNFLKKIISGGVIFMGILVMLSMVLWLTDQAYSKRFGTWPVPLGAQLAYPVNDFMDGIFYLRDNTKKEEVILGYISTGNYIPAYAGNYVYIGHANTPDEDEKELIAASFFKGEMSVDIARSWLARERISYVFYGPQERELGGVAGLKEKYDFLTPVYTNNQVIIYKII